MATLNTRAIIYRDLRVVTRKSFEGVASRSGVKQRVPRIFLAYRAATRGRARARYSIS